MDSQKGTQITSTPQGTQLLKLAHRMCCLSPPVSIIIFTISLSTVPRNDGGHPACTADARCVRTHPDLERLRHGSFVKDGQTGGPFPSASFPYPIYLRFLAMCSSGSHPHGKYSFFVRFCPALSS